MACTAWRTTAVPRFSALACNRFGSVGGLRRRPLLPLDIGNYCSHPADFYNPPYFVKLPDTAATARNRHSHHLQQTCYQGLVGVLHRDVSYPGRRKQGQALGLRQSGDRHPVSALHQPEHQFVFTVGGTAAIGGTGSPGIAASFSTLTPTVLYRQGLRRSAGFVGLVTAADG